MSQKVAVYSENRFRYFEAKKKVERKVALGAYSLRADGEGVDQVALNLTVVDAVCRIGYTDGPMGCGNLLPFSRVPNRLLKPEPLHYCIPACGAHSRFLNVFITNIER